MWCRLSKLNIVKKRRGATELQFDIIQSCIKDTDRVEFDAHQLVVSWGATIQDAKVIPRQ
jgi:hypothetical protein